MSKRKFKMFDMGLKMLENRDVFSDVFLLLMEISEQIVTHRIAEMSDEEIQAIRHNHNSKIHKKSRKNAV